MESSPPDPQPRAFEKWLVGLLVAVAGIAALLFIAGEGLIHLGTDRPKRIDTPVVVMPTPPQPAALAALRGYFEAADTTARSTWVRDGDRVLAEMKDFHERRGHPYPTMDNASPGQLAEFDGIPCVLFQVTPFNGPRFPVAVVWNGRRFVIDWESLTAYGTMDWAEWQETRPADRQTMRVFARATQLPPGIPPGRTAFLLEHRDDNLPVIALANGETAGRLASLCSRARAPVTIELEWLPVGPGGAAVAVISRLVHPGWSG